MIQLASLRSLKNGFYHPRSVQPGLPHCRSTSRNILKSIRLGRKLLQRLLASAGEVLFSSELRGNRHDEVIEAFRSLAASFSPTGPADGTASAGFGLAN
jgi:hypothetical protein